MKKKDSESGNMIIEATIVLPIVIITITSLLLVAVYFYEKAALQSAGEITLTYYKNSLTDAYVGTQDMFDSYSVADTEERTGSELEEMRDLTPFRFFQQKIDEEEIKKQFEIIYGYRCFNTGKQEVEIKQSGILFDKSIEMDIKDEIVFPISLKVVDIDTEKLTYNVHIKTSVTDNDQFIRDFSIAKEFVMHFYENSELEKNINNITQKFTDFYNKYLDPTKKKEQ